MSEKTLLRNRMLIGGGYFALLVIGSNLLVYQFEPFNVFFDKLFANLVTIISALSGALILTRVVIFYEKEEPIRRVWWAFALALWFWTAAEICWAAYNLTVGVVPALSAADIFWLAGYLCATLSLTNQFRLVLFDRSNRPVMVSIGLWGLVILATGLVLWMVGEVSVQSFFLYFYPIADFAIGLAALYLVYAFRRGTLARPWLSLFGFVVADSVYLWATTSGFYDWTSRGLVTLLVDLIYLLAYLFLGWGVFNQYLTLRFGVLDTQPTQPHRSKILPINKS